MAIERVTISQTIQAPLSHTFQWFYHSENFVHSPIVFKADWRQNSSQWIPGSERDIIMLAGWYAEEITEVYEDTFIRYRVNRSFPSVKQDFTEIGFRALEEGGTQVTWIIEIEVPTPFFQRSANRLAGKMAKTLYRTIMTAGKKELEKKYEVK